MKSVTSLLAIAAFVALSGCNMSFHDIGPPPPFTAPTGSVLREQIVPAMVVETPKISERKNMKNTSLWNFKDGIYFRDTRAFEVGDILTVKIVMNDSARFNNKSERETSVSGSLSGNGSYTINAHPTPTATGSGTLSLDGSAERGGTVNRAERIQLSVAATVIEAASNGNLHIFGTQEVRVNHELRALTVQGVVRASDIRPDNTIPYDKIAEARISYGGGNTRKRKTIFGRPYHRREQHQVK